MARLLRNHSITVGHTTSCDRQGTRRRIRLVIGQSAERAAMLLSSYTPVCIGA